MEDKTSRVLMKRILIILLMTVVIIAIFGNLNKLAVYAVYISNPKPKDGIVCVEEGTKFKEGEYDIIQSSLSELGFQPSDENQVAYIMSQNVPYLGDYSRHPKQEAIWAVLNQNNPNNTYNLDGNTYYYRKVFKIDNNKIRYQRSTTSPIETTFDLAPSFVKLYIKASDYSDFINNIKNISISKQDGYETKYNENGAILGPLKIANSKFGESGIDFNNIKVTCNGQEINGSKIKFCNEKGETTNLSTENFYIFIDYDYTAELSEKEIEFKLPYKKYEIQSVYEYVRKGEELEKQRVGEIKANGTNAELKVNFELPKLIPQLSLELNKTVGEDKLANIEFSITATQNGSKIYSIKKYTDANGYIATDKITPNSTNDITITIKETKKDGYKKIDDIVLVFQYDSTENTWKLKDKSNSKVELNILPPQADNICKIQLGVQNKAIIEKISLLKTDIVGSQLTGAKFKAKFTNIKYINSDSGEIILTTKNGEIELKELEIADLSKDIIIELEEIEAPKGYKKIEGVIKVTLRRTKETLSIVKVEKDETISEKEFDSSRGISVSGHEIEINIKNTPVINLGGIVWEDEQTGIKNVQGPNGLYESTDKAMAGVEVFLTEGEPVFNEKGELTNVIAKTVTAKGGEEVTYIGHKGKVTTTLQKGEYLFAGIEKKDNYYVVFKYDGINYKAIENKEIKENRTALNASKVEQEIEREEFNKKFQTITTGEAIAEDKSILGLSYESADNKSKLITKYGENIKPEFVMYAKSMRVDSSNWENTWTNEGKVNKEDSRLNINCGLTYRFFDLAIGMDVYDAKLTINGKETTYNYNQILDGELEDIKFENISKGAKDENGNDIIYNLYLYYSDYYYRISDYITDEITNNVAPEDSKEIDDNITNTDEELRAFVTYKVIIKNQSTINSAKVNELAYYYDNNYKFVEAKDERRKYNTIKI